MKTSKAKDLLSKMREGAAGMSGDGWGSIYFNPMLVHEVIEFLEIHVARNCTVEAWDAELAASLDERSPQDPHPEALLAKTLDVAGLTRSAGALVNFRK